MGYLFYYLEGFSSGWDIAKAKSAELTSFDEESVDAFKTLCLETEQNSDLEYLSDALDIYDAWDSYDTGIYEGIDAFIKQYIENNKE